MSGEVPALPVVVPVAVLAFAAMLWQLHRRGGLTVSRVLVAAVVCVYGAGVVANTIFPIHLDMPGGPRPWSSGISIRPFRDYEVADAVQNVVVFVPVGVLVPLCIATRSVWRVTVVGLVLSLVIETVQLLSAHWLHGGHVADVNDLFFNAVGAPLGLGLFALVVRVPGVAATARRVRWPST